MPECSGQRLTLSECSVLSRVGLPGQQVTRILLLPHYHPWDYKQAALCPDFYMGPGIALRSSCMANTSSLSQLSRPRGLLLTVGTTMTAMTPAQSRRPADLELLWKVDACSRILDPKGGMWPRGDPGTVTWTRKKSSEPGPVTAKGTSQ